MNRGRPSKQPAGKQTMKRLYSACPNRKFTSKMYEAPNAWQRFPNACRRVTSTAVLNSQYPDKARLFSGLIRVVRRQMTFNEASASHGLSLNLIKHEWKAIFTAMSTAMMKLMEQKKIDIRLVGDEMDEAGFTYNQVTEEDLITLTDEYGDEYAVVDPANLPLTHIRNEIYATHDYATANDEEYVSYPSTSQQQPTSVQYATPKEEEIDDPTGQNGTAPAHYVVPKEEEELSFSNGMVEPKEEEFFTVPIDEPYPSTSTGATVHARVGGPIFQNEKDVKLEENTAHQPRVKEKKSIEQPSLPYDDSLLDCSMKELGYDDPRENRRREMQRQNEEHFKDPDDEENPEICNAIRMTIKSSKLHGEQACVMREVLKDSMIRQVSVPDIAKLYGFADSQKITHMVNKARIFLKGICRRDGKGLPEAFTGASSKFQCGPPLLSSDRKRIQKINDVIGSLVKRCMYSRAGKERLKAALYSICIGEMTLNAAANKFNLPSSSIHPYVRKARTRLGVALPPQAHQPIAYTASVMKSAPAEQEVVRTRDICPRTGKVTVPMEELDEVVTEMVKASQYDNAGKQAIFEAVVSVIADSVTAALASARTGIPASTIQNYVWKAKTAMGLPQKMSDIEFRARKREAPTVALTMKQQFATKDEVAKMVAHMLRLKPRGPRKDQMARAVMCSVLGTMKIREAATECEIAPATLHPYVTKIRLALGERCPPPKASATTRAQTLSRRGARIDDEVTITLKEDEVVDIDGIQVPKSMRLLTRMMNLGRITYEKAMPFLGTREELYEKLYSIVEAFKVQSDVESLVDAIMHVYVDDKTINEACLKFRLNHTTLANYVRVVKIFVDFSQSPCTRRAYQYFVEPDAQESMPSFEERSFTWNMDMPDPLPRGPEGMSEEFEAELKAAVKEEQTGGAVVKEELMDEEDAPQHFCDKEVKEEPLDDDEQGLAQLDSNNFLNEEEAQLDAEWDGEGVDAITRKLSTLYECEKWMVDDKIGQDNEKLLPTLLISRVSDSKKVHRLKAAAQYVVNDRHGGSREAMYLRPLLIHHLCNGFDLKHLLEIYAGRITVTEEQLTEYASLASQMYSHAGAVVYELIVKLAFCNKVVDATRSAPSRRDEYEKMRASMLKEYPFLANPRTIPDTQEVLAKEEVKRRRTGVDLFVYAGLQAITQLRQLGFLLTDPFINEIVRVTSFNISPSFLPREHVGEWATAYMVDVIQTNADSI